MLPFLFFKGENEGRERTGTQAGMYSNNLTLARNTGQPRVQYRPSHGYLPGTVSANGSAFARAVSYRLTGKGYVDLSRLGTTLPMSRHSYTRVALDVTSYRAGTCTSCELVKPLCMGRHSVCFPLSPFQVSSSRNVQHD